MYQEIHLATFIERTNRFIAQCQLAETKEQVTVHVKNTGRGKELLLPGVLVALAYCPSQTRKTSYDLVAVKKGSFWFNIDSQAPNQLVLEGLSDQQIQLPGLTGTINYLKREQTYRHSKFDFYFETDQKEKGFIEVKGMTLENNRVGAFPDAPTRRGLKHVTELGEAQIQGYHCFIIFIAQFENIGIATIHNAMQPKLHEMFAHVLTLGVQVLAYSCCVNIGEITLDRKLPFVLEASFVEPF